MNTYKISYDKQHDGAAQSVDIIVKALGYDDKGDTLILFNEFHDTGKIIHVASFKNWNSITDISVVQE